MKLTQTQWIIIAVAVAAAAWYFLYYKAQPVAMAATGMPTTGASGAAAQAAGPGDAAAFGRIVALIQASQFSGDLDYILSSYEQLWAPGMPNQASEAPSGTITQGLASCVWTAWVGAYTTNAQVSTAPPQPGKTQVQATAAALLAQQVYNIWSTYDTQFLLGNK